MKVLFCPWKTSVFNTLTFSLRLTCVNLTPRVKKTFIVLLTRWQRTWNNRASAPKDLLPMSSTRVNSLNLNQVSSELQFCLMFFPKKWRIKIACFLVSLLMLTYTSKSRSASSCIIYLSLIFYWAAFNIIANILGLVFSCFEIFVILFSVRVGIVCRSCMDMYSYQ